MKNKKVSVIIPCYNCEKYLEEGIKSILNQSYKNIELIIVDDGSTDKSIEIIKRYEDEGKVRLLSQKHGGVSTARNLGIKKSTGDYIFFMDADDTINEKCIEILVHYAIQNSAEMVIVRHPNKFTKTSQNTQSDNRNQTVSGKTAALEMLTYKITIASAGRLFDKKIITNNCIWFDKDIKYGEGFNFMIENMLKSSKITITNEKLYNYRVDSTTSVMSRLKPGMIENSLFAIDRIESIVPKTKVFINAVRYARFHTACDMLNTVTAVGDNNNANKKMLCNIIKTTRIDMRKLNISLKERAKFYLYRLCPVLAAKIKKALGKRKFYS